MAGYQIFGKMWKISTLHCGKLCSGIVKQSEMKISIHMLFSRTYSTSALRRMRYMSKTHFQYSKNVNATCRVAKLFNMQNERYFSVEVATENVEGKIGHCKTELEIQLLVNELIERSLERDRMIAVLPKSDLQKHITTLVEAGLQKSDILNLHKYPELIKNLASLTDTISFLLEYGIPKENISSIINNNPKFVFNTKDQVLSRIKELCALHFTADTIVKMICNYPGVLNNELNCVPKRIQDLKTMFSTKDLFQLIERSPDLLFCEYSQIVQRFDYVYSVMGISQSQMRNTNLFSYPLEHIHARHMFVERAGFFKKLTMKKGQMNTNPTLKTIIDTTDEEFVKKFGNMSVTDYNTFKKLLKKDRVTSSDLEADYED